MLRIEPRSVLLAHNSFTARNTHPKNNIRLRFVETLQNDGPWERDRSTVRCSFTEKARFDEKTEELKYAFKVNLPTQREYQLKPYEAITFTIIGGLQPPEGMDKECLLKAVSIPKHNFEVQPLVVNFYVEFKDLAEEGKQADLWHPRCATFNSTFTKQLPQHNCTFVFDVTASTDPVELSRCCPDHSPVYHQNVFPYFPHGQPIPFADTKRPNCTCCQ
jgi:hypothetical protein